MRIFVAGGTGAIGRKLIPLLIAGGHQVVASTTHPDKFEHLRALGADPVVMNGLDKNVVMEVVQAAHPDAVVHQMTALASMRSLKRFDNVFELTNRLRITGTEYLLAAARAAGATKFIAQSYAGWPNGLSGGRIKTEDDPLESNPPKSMAKTLDAIRTLESMVSNVEGITGVVLRYGSFYGPGTSISQNSEIIQMVRQRKFPVVGNGAGVWSFLHMDDAAKATQLAIEHAPSGIYNVVDDEPAEVSLWLPYLAGAIGAKPPRHVPAWLAKFMIGEAGVSMMTVIRGSSNAKAKRTLHWTLQYSSWREGFIRGLTEEPSRDKFLRAS